LFGRKINLSKCALTKYTRLSKIE